jgi:hypothetical protein
MKLLNMDYNLLLLSKPHASDTAPCRREARPPSDCAHGSSEILKTSRANSATESLSLAVTGEEGRGY